MIYVITDNQFLFAGIELILRKYEITVYQLSADDLRSHKVRKDHVFFIECPLREENLHSLRKLYQYGARVCYLMRSSIECDRKNASQFIDIWIGPYISRHFLSLYPLLVRRRRYSR
ncbi:hypothetical protein RZO85_30295, partial [Raoultella ornithinolytica]|uniref:hypothetical protein n=1 Tax=Raoultella ornithinolytica TaxID=54291 RepID=UPI00292BB8FA